MYCPKCGKEIEAAKFCRFCGTAINMPGEGSQDKSLEYEAEDVYNEIEPDSVENNVKVEKLYKKPMALLLVVAAGIIWLFLALAYDASKPKVCDECGQEAKLTKYVLRGGMGRGDSEGEVEWVCDDCLRLMKFFGY